MALIKCEECGQMVSDKASACPHCGCPVKMPMVCPECGEAVAEEDSYCLKCGCPLNNKTQPQIEEQVDYCWDDEEKPNNTLKWLLGILAALVVMGGAALYAWKSGMNNKTMTLEDTVAVNSTPTMAAPVIELDSIGMYSIKDCPIVYEGLDIERHIDSDGSLTSISIKIDGELFQTINLNNPEKAEYKDIIHFLDANFDGYVDFILGNGDYGFPSMWFLWDSEKTIFVQATDEGNSYFVIGDDGYYRFDPKAQKIYYVLDLITDLKSWQGQNLQRVEIFTQIFNPTLYDNYLYHRYTIQSANSRNVIFSSDDPNKIPERWKKLARILTPEEEAEYANYYSSTYQEDESNDYSSSSMSANENSRELDEIRAQLENERSVFSGYFEQFRSLMQRYGTSSPDPYVYDNLMGSLNRMIEIADKGEKLARQLGKEGDAKWFRSQAQECRNGKNQLIYQH